MSRPPSQFWRPVTGIREPDGNPATAKDTTYSPLGAPTSNLTGPNFTPPFPAFPSGHAGIGAALFQILRDFYGFDRIPSPSCRTSSTARRSTTRDSASTRAAQHLGIHWAFDKTEGIAQGRRVAAFVFKKAFVRQRR